MEYEVKVPLLGFENIFTVTLEKIDDIFAKITTPDEGPSFTLINPYALREYSFDIPQATQVILDLNQDSEILLYNMVIIHTPIEESTVNFVAPIIFNASNNTMAQIILDSNKHKDFGLAEPIKNFMQKEEATQ